MKKLFQNLTLQINRSSSQITSNFSNQSAFKSHLQRRNFAFLFPSKSIKIPDEIRESGETQSPSDSKKSNRKDNREKIRMQNYESKFRLDPYDLDDYIIIGKEVFKNKFKEALIKKEKNEITEAEFEKMLAEDESQHHDKSLLQYKEFGNSKQINRRPFNSSSNYDQMHMFAIPAKDKIEPYTAIGMYRYSAPENSPEKLRELIYTRNKHISGFLPPFELGNGKLDEIYNSLNSLKQKYNLDLNSEEKIHKIVNDEYAENPLQSAFIQDKKNTAYLKEYLEIKDKLLDEVFNNLSFKMIPNLLMKFVFELGFNDKHFWTVIEQLVLDNLHHYNVSELSKIFYVATFACPKFTTEVCRSIIYEEVFKQLENCGADELMHVMFGFREIKNKKIFDKIANIIIAKKANLVGNKLEDISRLLYTYASHKPKGYGVNTLNPQRELVEKVVRAYEEDLIENLMKMNATEISRVASMLYLLRIENVDVFTNRVERRLLKLLEKGKDEVDAHSLHAVIRAFSKMKYNRMVGSDNFFSAVEDTVIELFNEGKFSTEEFTDIAFAYSVRGNLSEKMKSFFNSHIEKHADSFTTYHAMHNLFYYFMFIDYINIPVFEKIITNYENIDAKLPLVYYRPFKLFDYYLTNCPQAEETIHLAIRLKEKFYYAEQLYDFIKYERVYGKTDEVRILHDILKIRLLKDPITCLVKNNLLIMHFTFPQYKIGINVWSERNYVPKTNGKIRINEQCLLHSKLLKMKQFDVLDLVWDDFINLGDQLKKDEFLHNWYENVKISQHKKGVCNIKPKYV